MVERDLIALAESLSESERRRLLNWPDSEDSLFRGKIDAVAMSLCELGVGCIMPWKHGRQMGLTSGVGIPLHTYLKAQDDRHD